MYSEYVFVSVKYKRSHTHTYSRRTSDGEPHITVRLLPRKRLVVATSRHLISDAATRGLVISEVEAKKKNKAPTSRPVRGCVKVLLNNLFEQHTRTSTQVSEGNRRKHIACRTHL